MHIRSRREEGQVYPALLLAVIGGFAIAVSFVPLQNLLDQTGRADTAADSAALAAADSHRDTYKRMPPATGVALVDRLAQFVLQLDTAGMNAYSEAVKLANANGATVSDFRPDPLLFDYNRKRAAYEVTTMQQDTVKGGDASVKSKSRAVAIAEVTNDVLCGSELDPGVMLEGSCKTLSMWIVRCIPPPANTPAEWCFLPFPTPEWNVRLIKAKEFPF